MPNHVTNEIVFRDLTPEQRRDILAGDAEYRRLHKLKWAVEERQ